MLTGINGSALSPQFVANALGDSRMDKLRPFFFDNTDPDGLDRVLATIGNNLNRTCIITSKSGGTKETRNGMLVVKAAYEKSGLDFGSRAIASTMAGSELDKLANQNKWLTRFPMWDWVGGQTNELSTVWLLPAVLNGIDVISLISGGCEIDKQTRIANVNENQAMQLLLAWYASDNGKETKNIIFLPYKRRLELFSKYLQQLVMESLGNELDLDEQVVNQGITVLGNKGSTDQHSYIQQLRDVSNDFVVTFIEVLEDGHNLDLMVEDKVTVGDFLHGFYLGTRQALAEKGRESMTVTMKDVSSQTVGKLIALFERAVEFYASLININAYHQPSVEAGKMAAGNVIEIQRKILSYFSNNSGKLFTSQEMSKYIDIEDNIDTVVKVIQHLTANAHHHISKFSDQSLLNAKYGLN